LTDGTCRPLSLYHWLWGIEEVVRRSRMATTIHDATLFTRVRVPTPSCRRSPPDGRRAAPALHAAVGRARAVRTGSVNRRRTRPERQDLLEVGLLGPVEARRDAHAVPVPGSPQRTLLARLALAPGRPVPSPRLWTCSGPTPPAHAVRDLRSYVSRLRRAMRRHRRGGRRRRPARRSRGAGVGRHDRGVRCGRAVGARPAGPRRAPRPRCRWASRGRGVHGLPRVQVYGREFFLTARPARPTGTPLEETAVVVARTGSGAGRSLLGPCGVAPHQRVLCDAALRSASIRLAFTAKSASATRS